MTDLLLAVDPDKVKPGWLGLFVVLGLAVLTVLLWRSMNHQLKKVDFEEPPADSEADDTSVDGTTADNGSGSTDR
ncbi:MAG: hypothetical protein GEU96_06135 [Propionibacteriales bacterium]|nr:hypothetical protein [Propionibacteriales bacterium]